MKEIRVSVAMAVYNGERFLREQIDSILAQLGELDELVISYDKSTDGTKRLIDSYAAADSRVQVVENNGTLGIQGNFNNAITACRGTYIFLSDQDDVWLDGKVTAVIDTFVQTGADIVVHDGYMADSLLQVQPRTIFERAGTYDSPLWNLVKCNYWGCCMAFRASLRSLLCPIPSNGWVSHDHWIGILGGLRGKIVRCKQVLIIHRLHGSNVTPRRRRDLWTIFKSRMVLAVALSKRLKEVQKEK